MRLKRSPLAPKKTALQGVVIPSSGSPARRGLTTTSSSTRFGLDGMAAELIAQRGDYLCAERFVLARCHAREQRECDHGCRNVFVDGRLNGPATLAGVVDISANIFQAGIEAKRKNQYHQQPRQHEQAMTPELGNLPEIVRVLGSLENLEPLTIGLEQTVLDPVMNHLGEMSRAGGADVRVTFGWGQREKDWLARVHLLVVAADHETVALF